MPRLRPLLMAAPALLLLGCGTTSLGEIRRNAGAYEGRTVTVKGRVVDVNQVPFLGLRAYRLQDDTGELWVMASDNVPGRDERLVVQGTVSSPLVLGGSPLGLHLKETRRSKAWP